MRISSPDQNETLPQSTSAVIRVFLLDDDAIGRQGLIALLQKVSDIAVAGDDLFGPDMAQRIALSSPDVVILVAGMNGSLGTDVIREIHGIGPPLQLVVVATKIVVEDVFRTLQSGVKGYVLAEMVEEEIANAIRAVRIGRRYLSSAVSNALVDDYVQKSLSVSQTRDPLFSLNMREKEILQLVAEGKGSGVIAATLNLSVSTVNTYRSRVMKKLGLRDLTELVRFAIRNGLTPLSSCRMREGAPQG